MKGKQPEDGEHGDMLQWLIESTNGKDAETNRLVKRMLFLNMAVIHTTAFTGTNVLLDLCARPDDLAVLREEIIEAMGRDGGLSLLRYVCWKTRLAEEKVTFQRQLMVPFALSTGVTSFTRQLLPLNHLLPRLTRSGCLP